MLILDSSEKIVGEDEWKIPIVECPTLKKGEVRSWKRCPSCDRVVLLEVNGKTYYHKLSCQFSNRIAYGDERKNTTLPHHLGCDCETCEPTTKEKKNG